MLKQGFLGNKLFWNHRNYKSSLRKWADGGGGFSSFYLFFLVFILRFDLLCLLALLLALKGMVKQ